MPEDAEKPGALLPPTLPEPAPQDRLSQDDREDMQFAAKIGMMAMPVIIVHLVIIYLFISATTGFHLPDWLPISHIIGWFWINGAVIGWLWRGWQRRGLPFNDKIWLRGRGALALAALWFILSVIWMIGPALSTG